MNPRTVSLPAALFLALALNMSDVSAAESPGLSNRTFVDTRSSTPLEGIPKLIDETRGDGRRLISYEMEKQALTRPVTGEVTVYLQIKVPDFATLKGGWGTSQAGMGIFYGLEIKSFSVLAPEDNIQYKVGGDIPAPDTPPDEWEPTTFDTIIDIPLKAETYYFKINLHSVVPKPDGTKPGPLKISGRFKSARMCNPSGEAVTSLDSGPDLWIMAHGKNDGENSFQSLNEAVAQGAEASQVVSLDWSSGAAGWALDLSNGRYFVNLGKSLAGYLTDEGFTGNNVHWVGHSWGTLVGCETARSLGRVNRFVALDPATQAFGGYDDDRVDFGRFSQIATGVKGGAILDGLYGSEIKTITCDFSVRLISKNGLLNGWSFYHSLPRAWFIQAMQNSSDPYWTFFHETLLRNQVKTSMPPGWGKYVKTYGFDLECYGKTLKEKGNVDFLSHDFLLYSRSSDITPEGILTEARVKTHASGATKWNYTIRPPQE